MKENIEVSNRFFVNKYTVIYICITSILAYFILNFMSNNHRIYIPLMFRIYYIILSIVLFVLLNQVKKIYKQYVSKIVVMFFSLMIFISAVGFIININEKDFLSQFMKIYIELSKESILLIETFCSYALSEYYFKNKELKKEYYGIIILILASLGLIYYSEAIITIIKIIYLLYTDYHCKIRIYWISILLL